MDEARFWAKVEKTDTCWLWTGCVLRNGYGQAWDGTGRDYAHRISYELANGPIPDGLQIDHLCRVRHCVNPAHLEAVTMPTNILRGVSPAALNARKTHCVRDHEFTPENTATTATQRVCRTCKRDTQRQYRERKRAA